MSGLGRHARRFVRATAIAVVALANFAAGPAAWAQVADDEIYFSVMADELEYRANEGIDAFVWAVQGWRGTDYHKLWIKTEGEQELSGDDGGEAELQVLYSRLVAPFWDLQAGARYDQVYAAGSYRSRAFAVIGARGLAPYFFELEPALFVSEDGDVSARVAASYELLITQRLVAQPKFEVNVAAREVKKFGVGSGINDVNLGLRLAYEIMREFAPYIGVSWRRNLGNTADIARQEGSRVEILAFVAGVRLWF